MRCCRSRPPARRSISGHQPWPSHPPARTGLASRAREEGRCNYLRWGQVSAETKGQHGEMKGRHLSENHPVLNTSCSAPSTQYLISSILYPVLSTQYLICNTLYPVLSTQYLTCNTSYQILSTQYLISSTLYPELHSEYPEPCSVVLLYTAGLWSPGAATVNQQEREILSPSMAAGPQPRC